MLTAEHRAAPLSSIQIGMLNNGSWLPGQHKWFHDLMGTYGLGTTKMFLCITSRNIQQTLKYSGGSLEPDMGLFLGQ